VFSTFVETPGVNNALKFIKGMRVGDSTEVEIALVEIAERLIWTILECFRL
jgi:hypothetical protein